VAVLPAVRRRQHVDYALARRATLSALFGGRATSMEVCDAHPYLLRAARYHGEATTTPCPICRRGQEGHVRPLTHVTYVYGEMLGLASGRPRASKDLQAIGRHHPGVHVYVVEVCQSCAWNHLVSSYVLGEEARNGPPGGKRNVRAAER
jgi:hypothetical protein